MLDSCFDLLSCRVYQPGTLLSSARRDRQLICSVEADILALLNLAMGPAQ